MRGIWGALLLVLALAGCLEGGPSLTTEAACPSQPVTVEQALAIPVLVGGGRLGPGAAVAFPMPLNASVPADFPWSCVHAVEVVLSWTNTPTAGADLYVGVTLPSGLEVTGQDHQQAVLDGAHQESVVAAVGWGPHDAAQLERDLMVIVHSDWASLSQSGLDAQARVTLLV